MRKPRDFDAELKALHERQKQLRAKRVQQLGDLVIATGADALDAETLAGALLEIVQQAAGAPQLKEGWQHKGADFFRREKRARANGARKDATGSAGKHEHSAPDHGDDQAS